ncbi:hypothetical protein KCP69_16285 [Salmonella enterica subsp. enterica]|nr:hypothetical protein KCP69_16285 [Salmonella enterica subsp. enterica]
METRALPVAGTGACTTAVRSPSNGIAEASREDDKTGLHQHHAETGRPGRR